MRRWRQFCDAGSEALIGANLLFSWMAPQMRRWSKIMLLGRELLIGANRLFSWMAPQMRRREQVCSVRERGSDRRKAALFLDGAANAAPKASLWSPGERFRSAQSCSFPEWRRKCGAGASCEASRGATVQAEKQARGSPGKHTLKISSKKCLTIPRVVI